MDIRYITAEPWSFLIDHIEKREQGVWVWHKGVPYPLKFYHDNTKDPQFSAKVLDKLGLVKKLLFSYLYLKGLVVPINFNIRKYEDFLVKVYGICDWVLDEFFLKDEEYSVPVREIGKFVEIFLEGLGLTKICGWALHDKLSKNFSKLVMMMIEFDVAYRYPLQDLFGEINLWWFYDNPRKEVIRILEIYKKREGNSGRAEKVLRLGKLLSWILIFPKFKKALIKAMEGMDLDKIKFDKADLYHTSYWKGYDYGGKDFEARYEFFLETHKDGFPPYKKMGDDLATIKFLTE